MSGLSAGDLGQHVPRLFRVALRIVGDVEAAEDVAQEACAKALAKFGGFGGRSAMATWLHRITVNCAMDHLRQANRPAQGESELGIDLGAVAVSSESTPAATAERREMTRIALELVARLPDDCRAAFVLTQLDGYSYDETAGIEQQPRGTIASRVYRAKKILLEQMNAQMNGRAKS